MTLNQIFNKKCEITYSVGGRRKIKIPDVNFIVSMEKFVELHMLQEVVIHKIKPLPEYITQIIKDIIIYCDERNDTLPF